MSMKRVGIESVADASLEEASRAGAPFRSDGLLSSRVDESRVTMPVSLRRSWIGQVTGPRRICEPLFLIREITFVPGGDTPLTTEVLVITDTCPS